MDALFADFAEGYRRVDGYLLASTLDPTPPASDPARLYNFHRSTSQFSVPTDLRYKLQYNPALQLDKKEASAWLDVFAAFYSFVGHLLAAEEARNAGRAREAEWGAVYAGWKDVVSQLYKAYQSHVLGAWTIPCIYLAGKYLRLFAIKADEKTASPRDSGLALGGIPQEDAFNADSKNEKLEDAARQINRIFGLCISDRSPLEDSRKWALYDTANLLFKTYFKLNSLALCKNILRSLRASNQDMPPLSSFPKAHQVTFHYFCGVIYFLDEDYKAAEENLTSAYEMSFASPNPNQSGGASNKNLELILTYLIPTRLLTQYQLPSAELLAPYPRLSALFTPIRTSIRAGDLTAFNAAMEAGAEEFVKRRIYLTLERGRDIILRNIFRKVFLAGGFEGPKESSATNLDGNTPTGTGTPTTAAGGGARRTRVPVREFAAALQMAGAEVGDGDGGVDGDEVECLIANGIYKNLMKGYIARERGIVVLSKAGAFPGTGV